MSTDNHRYAQSGIIEPEELNAIIQNKTPSLKILDASFELPVSPDNPETNFTQRHIDGAQFFDITKVKDENNPLPHMLPTPGGFAKAAESCHIENTDLIVIYGQKGMIMGPARAWWMFRYFGHKNVCILNGGLPAWQQEGYTTTSDFKTPQTQNTKSFAATTQPDMLLTMQQVLRTLENKDAGALILDARPPQRFSATTEEPRAGLRSGHIPTSQNIPANTLIDATTGKIKSYDDLKTILSQAGYTENKKIIASCGSGVTACMIILAIYITGNQNAALYDGSWSEWGIQTSQTPISKDNNKKQI